MTRAEALEEARRRWGPSAWVILRRKSERNRFVVGVVRAQPRTGRWPLGVGTSWAEAFASAERGAMPQ